MVNMNSTSVMIAVLAAVAMLSAAVVVVPMQQAIAQDTNFDFRQYQSNRCSGGSGDAKCGNSGTIIFLPGHGRPGGS